MNQPPEYCPYCGTAVSAVDSPMAANVVDTPMIYECGSCDDFVFYNPTPGGSGAVVDGECILLVEDFRSSVGSTSFRSRSPTPVSGPDVVTLAGSR